MTDRHLALTPEALQMMDAIARNGSFAGAARELGRVPSALTYSVRQLEESLDVLLFDRRSGQARLTAAGQELLLEGRRLLAEMQGVANRVRRVATGWETQLTLAVDGVMASAPLLDLVEAFYGERLADGSAPPTRLRLATEVLAGTWEALVSGRADLAIGVALQSISAPPGYRLEALGELPFVLTMAPHHPLATQGEPISDEALAMHRAVAVADSASRLSPLTVNLLPGQDVLTVASNEAKREALLRGLGCGFLPQPYVAADLAEGRLVSRAVRRPTSVSSFGFAWRQAGTDGAATTASEASLGLGLQWWLRQLRQPSTRAALLHGSVSGSRPR
jgi:DNA-binding transcriptional LysR family regulator